MADHSALDREGAGSNPAFGFVSANPGYAAHQLARALATAEHHEDGATRKRAQAKAEKWRAVFEGMLKGSLEVGSRTPVADTPAWVTLEVVTGGFASGGFIAGGETRDHERELAKRLNFEADNDLRLHLNRFFISEAGVAELSDLLDSGRFEVDVPEEAAMLVVAWLLRQDRADTARDLLEVLAPFFGTLRFFPRPCEHPQRFGARVFLKSVKDTVETLLNIPPRRDILTQRETLRVWHPLYDRMIGLLLETVSGEAPKLASRPSMDSTAGGDASYVIEGGWPCQHYADDWPKRARQLLADVDQASTSHRMSSRITHRKSSLAQMLPLFRKCVADRTSLDGADVGKLRLLLARYVTRRGTPDSDLCREERRRNTIQAGTPIYSDVAQAIIPRLRPYPQDQGLDQLEPVMKTLVSEEAEACGLPEGSELPEAIARRIERSLCDSVNVLVERGIIPSGDVLAEVLPQMTSGLRAAGIEDPQLRQVYAATYRAFRKRRSLLLLNLEGQVKIDELPWVKAIEKYRKNDISVRDVMRQSLDEVACLVLTSFPQAIIPNKLLQEVRTLAKSAGLDIPVVDELAADIFMGEFSAKFQAAANITADALDATLYARYYAIDYGEVRKLPVAKQATKSGWFFGRTTSKSNGFAALCTARAGVESSGWDPAINGMIIEQQQVITTQNLVPLIVRLDLQERLQPYLIKMAKDCFAWICRRLQVNESNWHGRLIMVKNTAYAWRQMLVYLSLNSEGEQVEFLTWALEHVGSQDSKFQHAFSPAIVGLRMAMEGRDPESRDAGMIGRRFLGWSKSRHWLQKLRRAVTNERNLLPGGDAVYA